MQPLGFIISHGTDFSSSAIFSLPQLFPSFPHYIVVLLFPFPQNIVALFSWVGFPFLPSYSRYGPGYWPFPFLPSYSRYGPGYWPFPFTSLFPVWPRLLALPLPPYSGMAPVIGPSYCISFVLRSGVWGSSMIAIIITPSFLMLIYYLPNRAVFLLHPPDGPSVPVLDPPSNHLNYEVDSASLTSRTRLRVVPKVLTSCRPFQSDLELGIDPRVNRHIFHLLCHSMPPLQVELLIGLTHYIYLEASHRSRIHADPFSSHYWHLTCLELISPFLYTFFTYHSLVVLCNLFSLHSCGHYAIPIIPCEDYI
jgi:hypothetical protein